MHITAPVLYIYNYIFCDALFDYTKEIYVFQMVLN